MSNQTTAHRFSTNHKHCFIIDIWWVEILWFDCVSSLGVPEPPVIEGVPSTPVLPNTRLTLKCSSLGTSPDTQLVWYRNGAQVDSTYQIAGDYVVNEYDFAAAESEANLECRLIFPPTGLEASDRATIITQGSLYFNSLFLAFI